MQRNNQKVGIALYTYSLLKNEIGSKMKISVGSSAFIKGVESKLGRLSLIPSGGIVVGSGVAVILWELV